MENYKRVSNKSEWQRWVLAILCMFAIQSIYAEKPKYSALKRHNSDNDFPVNIIFNIVPDSLNFIWLNTNQGIYRFDGQNFKVFNTTELDPVYTNKVGFMDIINGQIFAMDETGYPIPIKVNPSHLEAYTGPLKLSPEGDYSVKHIEELNTMPKWLIDSFTTSYIVRYSNNRNKEGYISMPGGPNGVSLYFYRSGKFKRIGFLPALYLNQSFCLGDKLYYLEHKKGKGSFGTYALKEIDPNGNTRTPSSRFSAMVAAESNRSGAYVNFLRDDKDCYLYISNKLFKVFINEKNELDGELLVELDYNEDVSIVKYSAKLNKLFLGTVSNGFFECSVSQFNVIGYYGKRYVEITSSYYDNVFYQTTAYQDSIFFGPAGMFSKSGYSKDQSISTRNYHLFKTLGNKYIIGTAVGHTVFTPDLKLTQYNREFKNLELQGFAQKGELIYMGTTKYILIYKEMKDSLKFVRKIYVNTNEKIELIKVFGDSLLLGGRNGLTWLSLLTDKCTLVSGTRGLSIREITQIGKHNIFFGTYGHGWYNYILHKEIIKLPVDKRHYLDFVHSITEDSLGYVWVSTNNGLFRYLTSDLLGVKTERDIIYYNYFSKEYGFLINEFNGGGWPNKTRLKSGELVLPSMKGLVLFKPEKVPIEIPDDRIYFSDFTVDGRLYKDKEYLKLSPDYTNFQLFVFIPFYGHRYNLQVEYSIYNGDDEGRWYPLNENGELLLSRLEHGNYTLFVRVLSGFGSKKYFTRKIQFTVLPKWYQRKIFLIGLILVIGAFVYILFLFRVRRIKQQNIRLEALVDTRTSELIKSQDALKESYKFRSRVTSIILHDIRSPLHFLAKITERIYGISKVDASENLQTEIKTLHEGVVEIADYARNLMAWISTQEETLNLTTDLVDLAEIFNTMQHKYAPIATEKGIELIVNTPEKAVVKSNFEIVHIVVRNLLDNAIKYTDAGSVKLNVTKDSAFWIIQIIDTGIGISEEVMTEIHNSRLDKENTTFNKLGYRIIWDMLNRIHGELELSSEVGKGSKIEIKLPILEGN